MIDFISWEFGIGLIIGFFGLAGTLYLSTELDDYFARRRWKKWQKEHGEKEID